MKTAFTVLMLFTSVTLSGEELVSSKLRLDAVQRAKAAQKAGRNAYVEMLMALNPGGDKARFSAELPAYATNRAFISNAIRFVESVNITVIGGTNTSQKEFRDCVALSDGVKWFGSGVLIAKNAVLTTAHCGIKASKVGVGIHTNALSVYDVEGDAFLHKPYDPITSFNDIAILILKTNVKEADPAVFSEVQELAAAFALRVVGFGNTNANGNAGFGRKNQVDVPIVPHTCTAQNSGDYDCHAGLEFVAGRPMLDKDQCSGDSGGPAYVFSDRSTNLAGVVTRKVKNTNSRCGDGGIYVRIHPYKAWIDGVLRDNPP